MTLYETNYRAIVIHSSAHDKRRHKRIDRLLKKNKKELEQLAQKLMTEPYYCEADAQAAVEKLSQLPKKTDIFQISTSVEKIAKYKRERPKKGEKRVSERYEYRLELSFKEDKAKVDTLREEAGCFVLLSNLVSPSENAEWDAEGLLRLYKSQCGIEQNFDF